MAPSTTTHLPNSTFLSSLTTLLTTTHSSAHGSIFLTQKPYPSDSSDAAPTTTSSKILIRATNGKSSTTRGTTKSKPSHNKASKIKLSTIVEVAELEDFYQKYAEVCKKGMEGLRKRDRRKAKTKTKKGKKPEKE